MGLFSPLLVRIFLCAGLIGLVYFIPQGLCFYQYRTAQILFEENVDESVYALWVKQAADPSRMLANPYAFAENNAPVVSFAELQPLPAKILGAFARSSRIHPFFLLWFGSFFFPFLIALAWGMMVWLIGVNDRWWLCAIPCFSLLVLPPVLWWMQYRYTSTLLIENRYPGFQLTLPYSRRFQPQFSAILHYAAILFSVLHWRQSENWRRWGSALLTGACFGASFYSYYFSWTILLVWLVCGWCVTKFFFGNNRNNGRLWALIIGSGLVIALPYFVKLFNHFSLAHSAAAAEKSYLLPRDPAIFVVAGVILILTIITVINRGTRAILWLPLSLNLAIGICSIQNIITGVYVQPYHYLHYFARPSVSFALVLLCYCFTTRHLSAHWGKIIAGSFIAISLISGILLQLARYREIRGAVQQAVQAQPAFQQLSQQPDSKATLIFTSQANLRENIPLYTNGKPFFSIYQHLYATAETRDLLFNRIVLNAILEGKSAKDFNQWMLAKPYELFFLDLQKPQTPELLAKMQQTIDDLNRRFMTLQEERPAVFAQLRYALLPIDSSLNATRLEAYFLCEKLWQDGYYQLYRLSLR